MATQKTSIPKGTRDFLPAEALRRAYIFDTIKDVFKLYGYAPIETPAMENLSTLMGKYGEEGDKLIFRILNSGDFLSKASPVQLAAPNWQELSPVICEKALRYDLTVPFARFVAQHRSEISFPFKRYQIQPVWRADRPQKGRYREFFQCDADVVGSDSLLNEAELLQIIDNVFSKLNLKVRIKLNNRKILSGVAQLIGQPDKITDITVAIDKLDKIGQEKVNEELAAKGLPEIAIQQLQPIISLSGSNYEKLGKLKELFINTPEGLKGAEELQTVLDYLQDWPIGADVELDLSLARGLNYYTGCIIEVKSEEAEMGSITGGGRYDNLTGIFGLEGVSGVGISFGADRIYDVLLELGRFPESAQAAAQVLFLNFGAADETYSIKILDALRKNGIASEIYPEPAKIKKQMAYANSRGFAYVAMAGEAERAAGTVSLKNMLTGDQQIIQAGMLAQALSAKN
jgi:histidyl-tRNA synthetase